MSPFFIDKYEVTQAEYLAVTGWDWAYFHGHPNHPIEQVSWFRAVEYCNKRSTQEDLVPCYSYSTFGTNPSTWPAGGNTNTANHTNISCNWAANGYRLPTEMEWMFAAKGGNLSYGYTYSGSNSINDVAWYGLNSGGSPHDVGELAANELGIYDMSGNVWEWCWDIWSSSYPSGNQTNPRGPDSGTYRVGRGGCWNIYNTYCTVSFRTSIQVTNTDNVMGFRCVRNAP